MSNSTASYKQLKEDFVSGLTGGPVNEIVAVTAVLPVAALVWSVLQARQSFFRPYTALGFVVDYLLNIGAALLAITLYANSAVLLIILLLAPALLVCALPPNTGARRKKPQLPPAAKSGGSSSSSSSSSNNNKAGGRDLDVLSTKPFLTFFRGSILVLTSLAILAVDFRIFPRRFAKVETWGTSLMDVGVGAFVFSAGVVAARPVLKERAAHAGGSRAMVTTLPRRLANACRHSVPLLVLGIVRLLSVKGLDYAEHVTEYGVHWNFFFTLAFLPPFVALFQSALKIIPSYAALALILGVAYQVVLESTSLKAYILTAPRVDLLSRNREGVFSFLGYLAIFLTGQDTGMYVLPRKINPRSGSGGATQRTTLLMTLAVWCSIWSALYFLATDYNYGAGLSVSRRLANLPYILGVAALGSLQLFAYCLVETLCFPGFYSAVDMKSEKEAYELATSRVLRAYNRNGLAIFLLANLLTGLVNMTVPTLDVGPVGSIGILVAYSAVLTAVAVALDAYNINIKLS
ncbi:GPI-anchored wall transfer protein 1 [Cryphonectria parasitica EP155]|uniref:GPI-anchored wall transfer protein n=1 Tax=Cryphonectria parasitica (strain ATCC 38755 / EP155) TaxID=660469 RepID=A0A9P5CMX3_CRYP1|nr:GPI-anchored wall transfer protein 1 [Cryphonectria parasitica EP155]KAF3764568.1 GPI-anchored wall transfer protein 1 [Cryphonectria parasitica EP155]